jgi:hypothetical protein
MNEAPVFRGLQACSPDRIRTGATALRAPAGRLNEYQRVALVGGCRARNYWPPNHSDLLAVDGRRRP